MQMIRGYSGQQPGDPERAAAAIVQAVETPDRPLRLLLGRMALEAATAKLNTLQREFAQGAAASIAADYPDGSP